MILSIALLVLLISLNAFFAASEMAFISLNDNKIKQMAIDGDKKATLLVSLLSEPSKFLATIQIGITLAGFLASAFAADSFAQPLIDLIKTFKFNISDSLLKVGTVFVITVLLSYFTLVLGELVPKRVAMKKAESIAFKVALPLSIIFKFTSPFVKLLTVSTNFFVGLLGLDPYSEDNNVTEEEIRMMVDVGEEKGAIDEIEKLMINNIFELDNKNIEDIMTHRTEMVALPTNIQTDKLISVISENQYSRYPIYKDSIDNIVGILNVKDLLPLISENNVDFKIESYLRKPNYVPFQKKIIDAFLDMQNINSHIAIVIDEYGGTAGLVTIEDMLEEIVGNIFDEYDYDEDKEIKQIDEKTYEVSGLINLIELERTLKVDLPSNKHDTLSGMLISLYGGIPPANKITEIKHQNLTINIIEANNKRVKKVIIHINEETEEAIQA